MTRTQSAHICPWETHLEPLSLDISCSACCHSPDILQAVKAPEKVMSLARSETLVISFSQWSLVGDNSMRLRRTNLSCSRCSRSMAWRYPSDFPNPFSHASVTSQNHLISTSHYLIISISYHFLPSCVFLWLCFSVSLNRRTPNPNDPWWHRHWSTHCRSLHRLPRCAWCAHMMYC